jgi:3-phenylpropionate/trans-cinnamate dioxygenase ferredoxin reductase component
MNMQVEHVVVVGASAAGLSAAEGLRREGFTGRLTLVGDEPHLPYDRPPLSKQFLAGEWDAERLVLRQRSELDALGVQTLLGVAARRLDLARKEVDLADGRTLRYDRLVVATGVRAALPPAWSGLERVFTLRTIEDAAAVRAALHDTNSVLIVGAGFVGAEAASVCADLGVRCTMVDPLPQPMCRVLGNELGELLAHVHRERGVVVRCEIGITELIGRCGTVVGARLADGTELAADLVLVGVGTVPNVDWLRGNGLSLENGVICDERCRAGWDVYAAGDVAAWRVPGEDGVVRVEHRMHATEQGDYVARAIVLGDEVEPFTPTPFFWSDQCGLRIQSHGFPSATDRIEISQGALEDRRFLATYVRDERVSAVLSVNMAREGRRARALVGLHAGAALEIGAQT